MSEIEKVPYPEDIGESRRGLQRQSSQESLHKKRSWDNTMTQAYLTSQIIEETKDLEKIPEAIAKLGGRYKSHPEQQHDPGRTEKIFRKLTLHSEIPRAKRSGDISKQITDHATKIYNVLNKGKAPSLSPDQLKYITYLMELAVTQSDRTIRNRKNGAKADTRSSKEMNDELDEYRGLARRLEEWGAFLEGKREAPEISILPVTKELITSFEKLFPEAAKLIQENPLAMKLVQEAAMAGVKFGGYTHQGPFKAYRPDTDDNRAYTYDKHVYVPLTQTDPLLAMKDFLFELTNAIHDPQLQELYKEAEKGSLTRDEFIYRRFEPEIKGTLRIAELWLKMKEVMEKDGEHPTNLAKYNNRFWLHFYDYKIETSIERLTEAVLDEPYTSGPMKDLTPRLFFGKEYDDLPKMKKP